MCSQLNMLACLPDDWEQAILLGRVWRPGPVAGPGVVLVEKGQVYDISQSYPIMAELCNSSDLAAKLAVSQREALGAVQDLLSNSDPEVRNRSKPYFLAPCDLQIIKACGVTFASSMIERLVEEQAKGDPQAARAFRDGLRRELNFDLSTIKPGSPEAKAIKAVLVKKGLWSQYLEVGIGPDAEVFSKAAPMASLGTGETLGIRDDSHWNNPEPEVVLAVTDRGVVVGATLGNDVNLRDLEGRSALLLGKAKDNNGSSIIGPFIRIFDTHFTLDDVRQATVTVDVRGTDGFVLQDRSNMAKISRDVEDLVAQTISRHHQYPDGLMLYTGTLFSPTQDRDEPGEGFTHKPGDVVKIASPRLGALINRVGYCHEIPPWRFGIVQLMRNLSVRGLL
ncbi:MAG: fumarylacetoacetate hydrolase family protein [Deltaproteobacteria bacterium]|nr:fumarylacetoacetate hydrolase family protein [Deltaproteobacteria bacterium]